MTNINFYTVQLVKETGARYDLGEGVVTDMSAPKMLETIFNLSNKTQEHLVLLTLNTKNRIVGAFTVHIGSVDSSIVSPASIFQRALLTNARSILICHNHPSGDITPSPEDIKVTQMVADAGRMIGIPLIDHIIIGEEGKYFSLRGSARYSSVFVKY